MQITSIESYNDNYAYLYVVIDVLTKFLWVEMMLDKTMANSTKAFEKILSRSDGRQPECLQMDRGSEFAGTTFQRFLKSPGIRCRFTRDPYVKAAVVEGVNRSLHMRIYRYLTHTNSKRFINVLQKIVHA